MTKANIISKVRNSLTNKFSTMGSVGSPKVVLITGGNSGVGYEACKIFLEAEKPYHVLCAARSAEKASNAVKSLTSELPKAKNTIEPICVDVNDDVSIKKAVAQVEKSPGHLDVLINNAGEFHYSQRNTLIPLTHLLRRHLRHGMDPRQNEPP